MIPMNIFMSFSIHIGVKVLSNILREVIPISCLNEYKNISEIKCIVDVYYIHGLHLNMTAKYSFKTCSPITSNIPSTEAIC
jgi:hypothetical protein